MAHSRESKFFRSGTVSPVSVLRLNLQPKMCIPRMLWNKMMSNINISATTMNSPEQFSSPENLMQHHSSKGYNNAARLLGAICEEGTTYCNPVGHQKIGFPSVLTQSLYIPSNLSVRSIISLVLFTLICLHLATRASMACTDKLSWLLPAAPLPESASRLNCSCSSC